MNCRDGYDKPRWPRCPHDAEGWLISPEGKKIDPMCRSHAQERIAEFRAKLDETWTFDEQE